MQWEGILLMAQKLLYNLLVMKSEGIRSIDTDHYKIVLLGSHAAFLDTAGTAAQCDAIKLIEAFIKEPYDTR